MIFVPFSYLCRQILFLYTTYSKQLLPYEWTYSNFGFWIFYLDKSAKRSSASFPTSLLVVVVNLIGYSHFYSGWVAAAKPYQRRSGSFRRISLYDCVSLYCTFGLFCFGPIVLVSSSPLIIESKSLLLWKLARKYTQLHPFGECVDSVTNKSLPFFNHTLPIPLLSCMLLTRRQTMQVHSLVRLASRGTVVPSWCGLRLVHRRKRVHSSWQTVPKRVHSNNF